MDYSTEVKINSYKCDECGDKYEEDVPITLLGKFSTNKAGLLYPRTEFEFCSKECVKKWLQGSELSPS